MIRPAIEWRLALAATAALLVAIPTRAQGPSPIVYAVSFPAPEHHWLQVDVTFTDLGPMPLRARMSRSSPGRYAVHEFAKNVSEVQAVNGHGEPLTVNHPDADEWDVPGHDGTVRLQYRVFGDFADGTYLGVDTTHAHINMPATFMWAVGLDLRPIRIAFAPPAGSGWVAGTQLFSTADPLTFTAPNLQYFMDSPTELARLVTGSFSIAMGSTTSQFRVMVHGDLAQSDLNAFLPPLQRLVREEAAVYGEFPSYEPGTYTFLLDLTPWSHYDAMEHRNSAFITLPGVSLKTADGQAEALGVIAHEFFHSWNMERIRPMGLEPFDFTRENVTCCLWLGEGFTEYYGDLLPVRSSSSQAFPFGDVVALLNAPGRRTRSAVEMSEYAPFADEAVSNDLTDQNRTFLSYYSYGAALALALDLSVREQTAGRKSLDDFMRELWLRFGRQAAQPGYVARPYSLDDLRDTLTAVVGDATFAAQFFDKYVTGHDVPDFQHLLGLVGDTVINVAPGRAWVGAVPVQEGAGGLVVGRSDPRSPAVTPYYTPLYDAGVDEGDIVLTIDGQPASMRSWAAIPSKKPGDRVVFTVRRRDGQVVTTSAVLVADPRVQIVPVEAAGGTVTDAERQFRAAWLRH